MKSRISILKKPTPGITPWARRDGDWVIDEHRRRIAGGVPPDLLDDLVDPAARLWPVDVWPPLMLSDGLSVGSSGGHGPIRYRVIDSDDRRVRFWFEGDREGWHEFRIEGQDLVHEARLHRPSAVDRHFVVHLHDALIEQLLDDAEYGGAAFPTRRWPTGSRWRYLAAATGRPDATGSRRITRRLLAACLGAVGILHLAWAAGSSFPARTRADLARSVIGSTRGAAGLPSAGPTLVIGGMLSGLAGVVAVKADSPPVRAAFGSASRYPRAVLRLAEMGFAARGVAGYAVSTAARHPRYRVLNAVGYSPLCLLLAAGLHALLSEQRGAAVESH